MSNHHRIIAIKLFFTLLLACAGTNCMAIDIHPALLIKPNTKYYIYNNHYNRFLCTRNDREGFAGLSQWGVNDSIDYIFTVQATLHKTFILRYHTTVAHFTTSSRNRKDGTNRQALRCHCLSIPEIPDISIVGNSVSNGFRRINHTASTHSQYHINMLTSTKFYTFINGGQQRIGNHTP